MQTFFLPFYVPVYTPLFMPFQQRRPFPRRANSWNVISTQKKRNVAVEVQTDISMITGGFLPLTSTKNVTVETQTPIWQNVTIENNCELEIENSATHITEDVVSQDAKQNPKCQQEKQKSNHDWNRALPKRPRAIFKSPPRYNVKVISGDQEPKRKQCFRKHIVSQRKKPYRTRALLENQSSCDHPQILQTSKKFTSSANFKTSTTEGDTAESPEDDDTDVQTDLTFYTLSTLCLPSPSDILKSIPDISNSLKLEGNIFEPVLDLLVALSKGILGPNLGNVQHLVVPLTGSAFDPTILADTTSFILTVLDIITEKGYYNHNEYFETKEENEFICFHQYILSLALLTCDIRFFSYFDRILKRLHTLAMHIHESYKDHFLCMLQCVLIIIHKGTQQLFSKSLPYQKNGQRENNETLLLKLPQIMNRVKSIELCLGLDKASSPGYRADRNLLIALCYFIEGKIHLSGVSLLDAVALYCSRDFFCSDLGDSGAIPMEQFRLLLSIPINQQSYSHILSTAVSHNLRGLSLYVIALYTNLIERCGLSISLSKRIRTIILLEEKKLATQAPLWEYPSLFTYGNTGSFVIKNMPAIKCRQLVKDLLLANFRNALILLQGRVSLIINPISGERYQFPPLDFTAILTVVPDSEPDLVTATGEQEVTTFLSNVKAGIFSDKETVVSICEQIASIVTTSGIEGGLLGGRAEGCISENRKSAVIALMMHVLASNGKNEIAESLAKHFLMVQYSNSDTTFMFPNHVEVVLSFLEVVERSRPPLLYMFEKFLQEIIVPVEQWSDEFFPPLWDLTPNAKDCLLTLNDFEEDLYIRCRVLLIQIELEIKNSKSPSAVTEVLEQIEPELSQIHILFRNQALLDYDKNLVSAGLFPYRASNDVIHEMFLRFAFYKYMKMQKHVTLSETQKHLRAYDFLFYFFKNWHPANAKLKSKKNQKKKQKRKDKKKLFNKQPNLNMAEEDEQFPSNNPISKKIENKTSSDGSDKGQFLQLLQKTLPNLNTEYALVLNRLIEAALALPISP